MAGAGRSRRRAPARLPAGFSEGIFNHLTFVVPGRSDRYYQIPFGTHWSEVTASCFMEVGIDDGEVKRGEGEVSAPAIASTRRSTRRCRRPRRSFIPTCPCQRADAAGRSAHQGDRPDRGRHGREIAYDDEYTGPALDPAEGARLAGVIGTRTCCSWPITASPPSARPSLKPMTGSITSSAPRRCRSTRCGPASH